MSAQRHSELGSMAAALCLSALAGACADEVREPARDAAVTAADGGVPGPGATPAEVDAGPSAAASVTPAEVLRRLPKTDDPTPFFLSQVGLYQDIRSKMLAPAAVEIVPAFPLWSDGSEKQRWLILPTGSVIDTRDRSAWRFPVGTLAFKEFRAGSRRLETRLIARTGEGEDDFWLGAFVWNEDESDAQFAAKGALNVRGTQHDVPEVRSCGTCHRGDPARFLGLSTVQRVALPSALVSTPPAEPFVPPGNPVEVAALGYLHGNCAPCHNPNGSARPDTDLDLRLRASDRDVDETLAYTSTINVPLQYFGAAPGARRVVPGDPASSAILVRMRERGNKTQMPPLGSELTDAQGSAAIESWIRELKSL